MWGFAGSSTLSIFTAAELMVTTTPSALFPAQNEVFVGGWDIGQPYVCENNIKIMNSLPSPCLHCYHLVSIGMQHAGHNLTKPSMKHTQRWI